MTASHAAPDLTALVADANPYSAQIVRGVLARLGLRHVVEVPDGAEALSALQDRKPDLLVLDWQVPVVPAREIIAMARDAGRSDAPAMPVIVLMGEPTASAVSGAVGLKVDAILARPFSPRCLRQRVERAIGPRGVVPQLGT